MFRTVSLAAKIGGGFGLILLLIVLVSFVSWNGLRSVTNGALGYRNLSRDTGVAGSLQADMLMAQMNVKDFIIEGRTEDSAAFRENLGKMLDLLAAALEEVKAPERREKLTLIEKQIEEYKNGFEKVVQLRDERQRLVGELNSIGPVLEKSMTDLLESANSNNDAELAYEAALALKNLMVGQLNVIMFLESNEAAVAERVNKEFGTLDDSSKYLLSIVFTQEHRDQIKKVIELVKTYKASFDKVRVTIDERNTIIDSTLNRIGPEVAKAADEVKNLVKADLDALGLTLQKKSSATIRVMLIVAAIALVFGAICAVFLTRNITRPVGEVVDFVKELARGNFKSTLASRHNDEIGAMTDALNDMVRQLGAMIRDIGDGVGTLSSSSTDLATISDQLSVAARETSQKSETVSVAAEEMSTNMDSVSAAMEESAVNTNTVAAATGEMTATVNEIARSAENARLVSEEAVQKSHTTMEKMNELGDSASRIGNVTETITDISEQTNLLALNATIEAARAGEAGKGFAVVANEIKELAKQTADATVDIRTQIENMQRTTQTTVADMNEISSVIDNINKIINTIASAVEEQSATTGEIVESVSQTSEGIAEVNESVAQSSAVVADIAREIAMINTASTEVDRSSGQVQTRATELSDLAVKLEEMVKRFTV